MPSVREQLLTALLAQLETIPGATAKREALLPETVPAGGLIILRDGDPGDPEVVLSPVTYLWEHQSEIEVILQRGQDDDSAALDTLLVAVGSALAADRSLGGLAEWLDWGAPKTSGLAIDGASALRGATVPVTIHYSSPDPLG
ncbi:acyl-CoA transferase [Magnetospirillum sulfuroxidans]|uniref:Acyl-CoA transferase n=1 Tax=Magnetospirillum sulfuroxidans TaxID=611300 RepID=A0ABS5I9T2_9PROT|nr:acyl-CoA transferase [Magnetospirillum sulfuroxidans]MBR9971188.1 acyl-CoA transferase [Magnetospirillum sulfuroxidans]